ncbi:MAG: dihydrolipoamide acetyltransferase family protein [Candidatus Aminicenantales bacterium]|jgi:pyruvate dehydrogenase E2 component (dihydrolipoamide acetyltransferase)
MAKQFRFPDVGEGITEGEIVHWLVKEGDGVKADQTLAEIETDKAIVEMPSPYAGTVLKLHFKEKDIVKVGQVLVTIGEKGEAVPEAGAPAAEKAAAPQAGAGPAPAPAAASGATPPGGLAQATPKVRKLAQELGLDLATVQGTGPGGRITEEDLRSSMEKPAEKKLEIKVKAKYDLYGNLERIPLRGVRRATAKHMRESLDKAAHVTHFDEADVTKLAALREKMRAEADAKGIKLSYLPFIVKAVIEALKLHPTLNAVLDDEEGEIVVRKYYNIGIAVDVPDGLIVPVLKMADQKSVLEIAEEIQSLAKAARERALDLADLKGGTFSITNVGVIGGYAATPIINYPEVAILATMKIDDRARVENGVVVVKKTLPLCLSFDHRVNDGAEAARFTKDLIRFLEAPGKLPLAGE